jgi:hypothetical protein
MRCAVFQGGMICQNIAELPVDVGREIDILRRVVSEGCWSQWRRQRATLPRLVAPVGCSRPVTRMRYTSYDRREGPLNDSDTYLLARPSERVSMRISAIVARQQLDKHVSTSMNEHTTVQHLFTSSGIKLRVVRIA